MPTTMAETGLPTRKYNVELVKKNRGHWYDVKSLTGEHLGFFPGVTSSLNIISKPELIPWASRMATEMFAGALMDRLKGKKTARITMTPEWIAEVQAEAKARPEKLKDDAAELGTSAHQAIDKIILGESVDLDKLPKAVRLAVNNFRDWLAQSKIQIVMGDTRIASLKEKFGGSLDALGWRDDVGYILLDWKTNKSGIYPESALQVSAYCQALHETFGIDPTEAHVVRFGKELKEFEHKKVSNLTVSYGAFAAAKSLKAFMSNDHFEE